MQPRNVLTVAKREFFERIKTKGFWIATVLLPVFMAAMLFLPALVIDRTTTETRLVVVDATGRLASRLETALADTPEQARFDFEVVAAAADPEAQRAALDERILSQEIDAWVWVAPEDLEDDRVEYHGKSVSNFLTQEILEDALSETLRAERLEAAGYDTEEIAALSRSIDLDTVRVTAKGSRAEGGAGGIVLAFALFFMLYMVILIYGQQVMQGVLEEKTSRIVEVVVSAVRPVEMMGGKLVGICLVGLVQLGIWIGTALVLSAPGIVSMLALAPEDSPIPEIPLALVGHFFGLFLLGYFLFAALYAILGSAFNSVQEAQQMAGAVVIFVIAPVFFLMPVINDPDGTLATVLSLIPPFTPLTMLLRMAVQMPPTWQIVLGYVLTTAFVAFLVWLAARIYRVGILMYGKKPTLREIARWVRYA